jgi:hypothetical protein
MPNLYLVMFDINGTLTLTNDVDGRCYWCWRVLPGYLGGMRRAGITISTSLADPRMRIELEVTAQIGSGSRSGLRAT